MHTAIKYGFSNWQSAYAFFGLIVNFNDKRITLKNQFFIEYSNNINNNRATKLLKQPFEDILYYILYYVYY